MKVLIAGLSQISRQGRKVSGPKTFAVSRTGLGFWQTCSFCLTCVAHSVFRDRVPHSKASFRCKAWETVAEAQSPTGCKLRSGQTMDVTVFLASCSSGAMETGWTWLLMTVCQHTTISWFSPNPTTAMSSGAPCWRRLTLSKATVRMGDWTTGGERI